MADHVPAPSNGVNDLARRADRIRARDERVVAAMSLAATFDDGQEAPTTARGKSLTPLERQVAKDARQPKRFAPMYLDAASRRYENHQKIQAQRPQVLGPINAVLVIVGRQESRERYNVVDIAADGRILTPVKGAP